MTAKKFVRPSYYTHYYPRHRQVCVICMKIYTQEIEEVEQEKRISEIRIPETTRFQTFWL